MATIKPIIFSFEEVFPIEYGLIVGAIGEPNYGNQCFGGPGLVWLDMHARDKLAIIRVTSSDFVGPWLIRTAGMLTSESIEFPALLKRISDPDWKAKNGFPCD